MKRQVLLKKINQAAKTAALEWTMVRPGSSHDIWRCGSIQVSIPRHREINDLTAEGICKDLTDELGKDWWR